MGNRLLSYTGVTLFDGMMEWNGGTAELRNARNIPNILKHGYTEYSKTRDERKVF